MSVAPHDPDWEEDADAVDPIQIAFRCKTCGKYSGLVKRADYEAGRWHPPTAKHR